MLSFVSFACISSNPFHSGKRIIILLVSADYISVIMPRWSAQVYDSRLLLTRNPISRGVLRQLSV